MENNIYRSRVPERQGQGDSLRVRPLYRGRVWRVDYQRIVQQDNSYWPSSFDY